MKNKEHIIIVFLFGMLLAFTSCDEKLQAETVIVKSEVDSIKLDATPEYRSFAAKLKKLMTMYKR